MPEVEIAWADGEDVRLASIHADETTTLAQALEAATAAGLLPAALLDAVRSGAVGTAVYGRARPLGYRLEAGDRIELLGPLTVDPKVARQRRVAHRRAAQGRSKWNPDGPAR